MVGNYYHYWYAAKTLKNYSVVIPYSMSQHIYQTSWLIRDVSFGIPAYWYSNDFGARVF